MLAAQALARGVDSPSLRVAAGVSTSDVREARDRFVDALEELGIDIPDPSVAAWRLTREKAAQIVRGEVQPYEGAWWIWREAYSRVARAGDLRMFIGLASEWEDHPDHRTEYDKQIIEEAKTLLARAELRQGVKLMAKAGSWPLWQHSADGRPRCLGDAELPLSHELHHELAEWAFDFDSTVGRGFSGPSGFESQRDAEQFVDRGRLLVVRLQAELGDGWHVEYMPTPTAFPHRSDDG